MKRKMDSRFLNFKVNRAKMNMTKAQSLREAKQLLKKKVIDGDIVY